MKYINFLSLCVTIFFTANTLNAQVVNTGKGLNLKADTINKMILENAKYRIYYILSFSTDTLHPEEKTECQTLLLIGSRYNAFLDYNTLRKDSIFDALVLKKASTMEIVASTLSFGKLIKFKPTIIKNYPDKDLYTFQEMLLPREVYRYVDEGIKIEWLLGNEEKEIQGYLCKNASCTYRGRQYTAWYTPEIPISEGPYVFSGLPGLIMEISDARQHYLFSLNGLTTVKNYNPIYLSTDYIVESSREQVRKAIANAKKDPASILQSLGGKVKISEEAMAKLKPKFYNPIELE